MNVLLVHVTADRKMVAVLLPSATPTSNSSGQTPNQAVFAASCRTTGDVLPLARANISVFLGRLRQEASGKDAYGIKVSVDGCSAATGQMPVELTVLSKL